MRIKLDAKTISALALPKGKTEDFVWDTELDNFGLRLRRRGDGRLSRSFIVQYRADHRTRRPTIANADKVTPAQARDAARKHLAQVELGRDPQAEKALRRAHAAHTVRATIAAYLEARRPELRPGSFRIAKLYLQGRYFADLHPMPLSAVTRSDVAACIRAIQRNHSATTAGATRRALSTFFAWAIAEGLLGDGANPVDGSFRPDGPIRGAHVPAEAELAAIWRACGDDDFGRIVRLLILLASRRQEVGGMRWSELDLERGMWTLPAARSKNHRPLTVTLPEPALAIIASVPRTSRNHLFGDRAGSGFTGWSHTKEELDRRLGSTVRPWRLHDIRRAVATAMANNLRIEPHIIEAVLNHYSGHRAGVAGIYNLATYDQAIAIALARWSEHLLALVEGRASNVIALQRA
jgi:integrase